jgi:hypothetical protein
MLYLPIGMTLAEVECFEVVTHSFLIILIDAIYVADVFIEYRQGCGDGTFLGDFDSLNRLFHSIGIIASLIEYIESMELGFDAKFFLGFGHIIAEPAGDQRVENDSLSLLALFDIAVGQTHNLSRRPVTDPTKECRILIGCSKGLYGKNQ